MEPLLVLARQRYRALPIQLRMAMLWVAIVGSFGFIALLPVIRIPTTWFDVGEMLEPTIVSASFGGCIATCSVFGAFTVAAVSNNRMSQTAGLLYVISSCLVATLVTPAILVGPRSLLPSRFVSPDVDALNATVSAGLTSVVSLLFFTALVLLCRSKLSWFVMMQSASGVTAFLLTCAFVYLDSTNVEFSRNGPLSVLAGLNFLISLPVILLANLLNLEILFGGWAWGILELITNTCGAMLLAGVICWFVMVAKFKGARKAECTR
jgi:hypothetical protein